MSFNFGSPAEIASLYIDSTVDVGGPGHPSVHYHELPLPQIKNALTYLGVALARAMKDEAEEEVVEIIRKEFEEIVLYLADMSEEYSQRIVDYKIEFPGGPKAKTHYRDLILSHRSAN